MALMAPPAASVAQAASMQNDQQMSLHKMAAAMMQAQVAMMQFVQSPEQAAQLQAMVMQGLQPDGLAAWKPESLGAWSQPQWPETGAFHSWGEEEPARKETAPKVLDAPVRVSPSKLRSVRSAPGHLSDMADESLNEPAHISVDALRSVGSVGSQLASLAEVSDEAPCTTRFSSGRAAEKDGRLRPLGGLEDTALHRVQGQAQDEKRVQDTPARGMRSGTGSSPYTSGVQSNATDIKEPCSPFVTFDGLDQQSPYGDMRVVQKNTFLDLEPAQVPGRLRSIGTWAGCLAEDTPHPLLRGFPARLDDQANGVPEKRMQDTPSEARLAEARFPEARVGAPDRLRAVASAGSLCVLTEERDEAPSPRYFLHGAQDYDAKPWTSSEVRQTRFDGPEAALFSSAHLKVAEHSGAHVVVKNTFLDMEPEDVAPGRFRNIGTWAGSLARNSSFHQEE